MFLAMGSQIESVRLGYSERRNAARFGATIRCRFTSVVLRLLVRLVKRASWSWSNGPAQSI